MKSDPIRSQDDDDDDADEKPVREHCRRNEL
jgi:hypothetical protein